MNEQILEFFFLYSWEIKTGYLEILSQFCLRLTYQFHNTFRSIPVDKNNHCL